MRRLATFAIAICAAALVAAMAADAPRPAAFRVVRAELVVMRPSAADARIETPAEVRVLELPQECTGWVSDPDRELRIEYGGAWRTIRISEYGVRVPERTVMGQAVGHDMLYITVETTGDVRLREMSGYDPSASPPDGGAGLRCSLRGASEGEVADLLRPLCGAAQFVPVVLKVRRGEQVAVGSGVWGDGVIVTVGHNDVGLPADVHLEESPGQWLPTGRVELRCASGLCGARWPLADAARRAVVPPPEDGIWLLVTHPGEPPEWQRPDGRIGNDLFHFAELRHLHQGASGSGAFERTGGRLRLLGVLSMVGQPEPRRRSDNEFYASYVPVPCDARGDDGRRHH